MKHFMGILFWVGVLAIIYLGFLFGAFVGTHLGAVAVPIGIIIMAVGLYLVFPFNINSSQE